MGWRAPAVEFFTHVDGPRRGPVTRREERRIARQFLGDLEAYRLEVCLTRAPDPLHAGHMVRLVCSQNPAWYQAFCKLYGSARRDGFRWSKHKTAIKRRETLRALERILRGGQRLPTPSD